LLFEERLDFGLPLFLLCIHNHKNFFASFINVFGILLMQTRRFDSLYHIITYLYFHIMDKSYYYPYITNRKLLNINLSLADK